MPCSLVTLGGTILTDLLFMQKNLKNINSEIMLINSNMKYVDKVDAWFATNRNIWHYLDKKRVLRFHVKEISIAEENVQGIASRKAGMLMDLPVNCAL